MQEPAEQALDIAADAKEAWHEKQHKERCNASPKTMVMAMA